MDCKVKIGLLKMHVCSCLVESLPIIFYYKMRLKCKELCLLLKNIFMIKMISIIL